MPDLALTAKPLDVTVSVAPATGTAGALTTWTRTTGTKGSVLLQPIIVSYFASADPIVCARQDADLARSLAERTPDV